MARRWPKDAQPGWKPGRHDIRAGDTPGERSHRGYPSLGTKGGSSLAVAHRCTAASTAPGVDAAPLRPSHQRAPRLGARALVSFSPLPLSLSPLRFECVDRSLLVREHIPTPPSFPPSLHPHHRFALLPCTKAGLPFLTRSHPRPPPSQVPGSEQLHGGGRGGAAGARGNRGGGRSNGGAVISAGPAPCHPRRVHPPCAAEWEARPCRS